VSSVGDLERLVKSFERHLRAENKSARTVQTYGEAVDQFVAYALLEGVSEVENIATEHVEGFIGDLLATRSAATGNNRFRALQQFFRWLHESDHKPSNPMEKMKPPSVPERPVPVVSANELRARSELARSVRLKTLAMRP
jgi:site-specific recombinase XerD